MEGLRFSAKHPTNPSPLDKLLMGTMQQVQIPLRYMLCKVMEDLKSPKIPVFICTKTSDSCFQASVKLDMSTIPLTVQSDVVIKEFRGEVSSTVELAVTSAIKQAFEYLDSERLVMVKDHSSKVYENYSGTKICRNLNIVSLAIEEGFQHLKYVLDKVGKYEMDLVVDHMAQINIELSTPTLGVYADVSDALNPLLEQYSKRYRGIRRQFEYVMAEWNDCRDERNRNANATMRKEYGHVAYITEKNILEYVLGYLGLEAASYENEYVSNAGYMTRVHVKVPDVENANCRALISIAGITRPSVRQSEEEAAYSALKFLEDELKVEVVDLNYAIQLKAKQEHQRMVTLLHSFQALAEKVRQAWKQFNISTKEAHDFFSSEYKIINHGYLSDHWINILDECTATLKCMHDKSVDNYDIFCRKLHALDV